VRSEFVTVRRRLALLLLLGLVGLCGAALSDGAAQGLVRTSGEPAATTGLAGAFVEFQRTANREIARHLKAIRDGQGAGPLALGLLLAFLYGAVHAAGPGHGKLVVVGYFLSREARVGRGLAIGAQIAAMHVVSAVIVVGLADLLLRRTFGGAPAEVPAVRIASYALIVALGLVMLARAVRRLLAGHATLAAEQDHARTHRHAPGCGCAAHARAGEGGLLALAVGLVPCTGSLLVLLWALANDMLATGFLLVGAIALGMAITMGGLGLASVWARRFVLDRIRSTRPALLVSGLLELAGAALVTAVGGLLLAGSL
jgi:ABC-type nickel/cobalt efflux system permease component RcnA